MNLNKVDRIIQTYEDTQALDEWWLNIHQGNAHYIPPVLEEGLIILKASEEQLNDPKLQAKDMQIYFKQLNKIEVYYEIHRTKMNNQTEKVMSATKNYEVLQSKITIKTPNSLGINSKNAVEFLDSAITPHIALMNYMAFYPDRVSTEKVRTMVSKKQQSGKKKKPVVNVVYKVMFPSEKVTEQEKQEFRNLRETWIIEGREWNVYSGQKGVGKALLKESAKAQYSMGESNDVEGKE